MANKSADSQAKLLRDIVACRLCPRLVVYREAVALEKRKAYRDEDYWGKPVPNFGDKQGKFLIVGLAPAAHGANRTGRMFTGDRSGQWLYRALHQAGFANQSTFEHAEDGLELKDAVITATAHCAPPDNKPLPEEILNCESYLTRTFALHRPRVVLALGSIGWTATFNYYKRQGLWKNARPEFGHGAEVTLDDGNGGKTTVIGSYHPSQQNTFTGRLTEEMFDTIFTRAREILYGKSKKKI